MRTYKSFLFPQKSTTTNHCDIGINGNNMVENMLQDNDICPVDVFDDDNIFDFQQDMNTVTDPNTNQGMGLKIDLK